MSRMNKKKTFSQWYISFSILEARGCQNFCCKPRGSLRDFSTFTCSRNEMETSNVLTTIQHCRKINVLNGLTWPSFQGIWLADDCQKCNHKKRSIYRVSAVVVQVETKIRESENEVSNRTPTEPREKPTLHSKARVWRTLQVGGSRVTVIPSRSCPRTWDLRGAWGRKTVSVSVVGQMDLTLLCRPWKVWTGTIWFYIVIWSNGMEVDHWP